MTDAEARAVLAEIEAEERAGLRRAERHFHQLLWLVFGAGSAAGMVLGWLARGAGR